MNKNVLIGVAVVVVLILALPLAAKLKSAGGGAGASGGSESSATSAPAAPVDSNQPPYWNAGNLPGTSWVVSGVTVNIQQGGIASASTPIGQLSGTWAINGSTLTVKAAGREVIGQISGEQILIDGAPAQRAQ